jgi:predicted nucleic acid-binding protein
VSTFVDTSVWFAAANVRDQYHAQGKEVLGAITDAVLSDHVLVETLGMLNVRVHQHAAERFWEQVRNSPVELQQVVAADLERAWAIGEAFPDQEFSIVDRTSFALMERLGITRVASFDYHFAVYRYGRARDRAFEVIR